MVIIEQSPPTVLLEVTSICVVQDLLPRLLAVGVIQVQLPLREPFNAAYVQAPNSHAASFGASNPCLAAQPGRSQAFRHTLGPQHGQHTLQASESSIGAMCSHQTKHHSEQHTAKTGAIDKTADAAITGSTDAKACQRNSPFLPQATACLRDDGGQSYRATGATAAPAFSSVGASAMPFAHADCDPLTSEVKQSVSWLLRTEPASGCVTTAEAVAR